MVVDVQDHVVEVVPERVPELVLARAHPIVKTLVLHLIVHLEHVVEVVPEIAETILVLERVLADVQTAVIIQLVSHRVVEIVQ